VFVKLASESLGLEPCYADAEVGTRRPCDRGSDAGEEQCRSRRPQKPGNSNPAVQKLRRNRSRV
ncbi:MAG: hypothetical protein M1815_005796, partial [Lichina confinis]